MVFISNRKNYMFRPIAAIFRFDNFLAKRVLYNMPKPRGDVKIIILRAFVELNFVVYLLGHPPSPPT